MNHNCEKMSKISFNTEIPTKIKSSKPPILNVYSKERRPAVALNDPIIDFETGFEGDNQILMT